MRCVKKDLDTWNYIAQLLQKLTELKHWRNTLIFEKIIGFGDNLNDLPMFEFADEAYAPANAVDEIKAIATGVIGHHDEDAIALYIKERYERHQK